MFGSFVLWGKMQDKAEVGVRKQSMADMGENVLEISGESEQQQRFWEQADEHGISLSERDPHNGIFPSVLSFYRLYPMPQEVVARGYDPPGGGYDWQKEHWGVKWGAADAKRENFQDRDGTDWLIYTFDTAWQPPLLWLGKVSADYPRLCFALSFRDPNTDWVDEYVFQNGKQIEEENNFYATAGEDCATGV